MPSRAVTGSVLTTSSGWRWSTMKTTEERSIRMRVSSGVYVLDLGRGGFQRIDVRWGEFVPCQSPEGRVLLAQCTDAVVARDLGGGGGA